MSKDLKHLEYLVGENIMGGVEIRPLNMESYDRLQEKGFEPYIYDKAQMKAEIKEMDENETEYTLEDE